MAPTQSDDMAPIMAPAAPAPNATEETTVRSYKVWHTIYSMPNYSLSFIYCKTYYDYIVARYLLTRLVLGVACLLAAAGQGRGGRRGAACIAARSRGGPAVEARGGVWHQPEIL